MKTDTFLIKSPNLEIYQTDDLRKWISIYLHACRSRNLAAGTIEFYDKKLNAFVRFCSEHAVTNVKHIKADHIRHFLILLDESGHRPAGTHCYYRSIKTFFMGPLYSQVSPDKCLFLKMLITGNGIRWGLAGAFSSWYIAVSSFLPGQDSFMG